MKKYRAVEHGFLSAKGFRSRRSETLVSNPDAALIEEKEIKGYLKRLNPGHVREIVKLADVKKNLRDKTKS